MADTIEGVNLLTTLGFVIEEPTGFLGLPEIAREEVHVLKQLGARFRSDRANARGFEIAGYFRAADNATALSNIGSLKTLLMRGLYSDLDIRLDHKSGYKVNARFAGGESFEPVDGRYGDSAKWRARLPFRVGNPPYYVNLTGSTVSNIQTTDTDIPQGSAPPISAVLAILEPTDPTITYKDHNGTTIAAMEFSFTPVSGEYLVIDISKGEIYRNTTGVPGGTEASTTWTPGTPFVRFDDFRHWDHLNTSWATLAISDGVGELTYTQGDF